MSPLLSFNPITVTQDQEVVTSDVASDFGSSKTAEVSEWERSSTKNGDDSDSVIDSNSPPTTADDYDADSESSPLPRYDTPSPVSFADSDSWENRPRSYDLTHLSPLPHHTKLTAQRPRSIHSSPRSSPFPPVTHYILTEEVETFEIQDSDSSDLRPTPHTEVVAEKRSDNEDQQQGKTDAHLAEVSQSVSSVYESLFGCRRSPPPTPEELEEARLAREHAHTIEWEYSSGPFGNEHYGQNYHQRSRTEQPQLARIESNSSPSFTASSSREHSSRWFKNEKADYVARFLKDMAKSRVDEYQRSPESKMGSRENEYLHLSPSTRRSSTAISVLVRTTGDDWDFAERVERDGKIEIEKARYQIGMKGFLRLNR